MSLDAEFLNRAAPPGSMRHFALLYARPQERAALGALLVIDAEIRATLTVAHEVAHTRLQWWRGEIDRLVNRDAQHPATRALQAALPSADFSMLHETLVAADMDLARMTYHTPRELNAYLERSAGSFRLLAPDDPTLRRAGAFIRRVESLRDLALDARAGRIYWPLDELQARKVSVEELANPASAGARRLLADEVAHLHEEFANSRTGSRGLYVLAALHEKLLQRIERADYNVFNQRHELGGLEKLWTAWRAARKS